MSWSFYAAGKAPAVAKKAVKDLSSYQCQEPEETIKTKVGELLAEALGAYPTDKVLRVEASGHQETPIDGKAPNYLNVKIESFPYFVEDAPDEAS